MDFTLLAAIVASLATTSLLLITFIYNILIFHKGSSQKVPEADGAWPIIGHLHLLCAPRATFKILADMVDKYSPIFRLRLGAHQVLVISDSRIAKECFTTNDRALAGRPKTLASEIRTGAMPARLSCSTYCPTVVQMLRRVWELGVTSFTQDIYRSWLRDNNEESEDVKLEMKELFGKLVMDIMMQILFGKQYEEERKRTVVTVRRFFDLLGTSVG
ncbi:PREDICTED: cytochrome P450 82A4-like [Ipomoea nil]|uniref:cytochrome P450 82A4-like n=1 Tax=Ipomoea nil TaxID=35883 RepID=UPI0009008B8D|nr:PREDICTED: cytochrome P450 82A4-like [Ipomoea nil]